MVVIFLSLYKDPMERRSIIIDRMNNPIHCGTLKVEPVEVFSDRCADKMKLYLKWEHNVIIDAKVELSGCAIFAASTDIFIDYIKNKNKKDVIYLAKDFENLINQSIKQKEELGLLNIFDNVKTHLNRLGCANMIIKAIKKAVI